MAIAKRVCTACGEAKKPNIDFYLSRSKLYKFNDARMPICKECLSNLFKELNAKYSDETKALYHLCMLFDIYFSKELVEKSNSNNNYSEEDTLLKTYMHKGGMALHGNVFNPEDLKKAQKDPELCRLRRFCREEQEQLRRF